MLENTWTQHIVNTVPHFKGYETEVRLWDRTRPDLVGPTEILEVDWSAKWKEGVGQACFYGMQTGLNPGLLLLFTDGINSEKERLRGYRAKLACIPAGISLYLYDCRDEKLILA